MLQYHQWLDSIKVVRDNGELSELGLQAALAAHGWHQRWGQERVELMERSIIKQAQELQNTK